MDDQLENIENNLHQKGEAFAESVKGVRLEMVMTIERLERNEAAKMEKMAANEHEMTAMRQDIKAMRQQMLQMSEDNEKMRKMMKQSEKKENPEILRLGTPEPGDTRATRKYHIKAYQ
jgi:cysteine synthase